MIQVDVYSGFLGAGKTTLIKKMLKEVYAGEKIVLLENEFGEVGIDGGFMKDAGIQITEMNSGCICCSLAGELAPALQKLAEDFSPSRILVEPSGVGKLSDVIRAIEKSGMKVSSTCAVVDARKCKVYLKNFAEFFTDQIEKAGTIVLSRTDGLSQDKLTACVDLLRSHNPRATIITTPWDQLSGKSIQTAMQHLPLIQEEEHEHHHDHDHGHEHNHEHEHEHDHHHHDGDCGCHHHHHHADEVFQSVGMETPRQYSEEELRQMLGRLSGMEYGTVLRAKGILPGSDGTWIHFDYVPGDFEIRHGTPDYTGRLCVIGSQLDEEAIRELFAI